MELGDNQRIGLSLYLTDSDLTAAPVLMSLIRSAITELVSFNSDSRDELPRSWRRSDLEFNYVSPNNT